MPNRKLTPIWRAFHCTCCRYVFVPDGVGITLFGIIELSRGLSPPTSQLVTGVPRYVPERRLPPPPPPPAPAVWVLASGGLCGG